MIKELVQFSSLLSDDFKIQGTKPRTGIHILLSTKKDKDGSTYLDSENFKFERYTKKSKSDSDFLEQCKMYQLNAWCIDTNKCFDLPTKAIHSCSPFCVAFKREHLKGGIKFKANEEKDKSQIHQRFKTYFEKANSLFEVEEEKEQYKVFQNLFISSEFEKILNKIEDTYKIRREELEKELESIKEQQTNKNKEDKNKFKDRIKEIGLKLAEFAIFDDSEYFLFYFDEKLETYKKLHQAYLSDKLFNSDKFNTEPNEEGLIYGTNNFLNGFNVNKPFLLHKTAPFDITGRITNKEALNLYELKNVIRLGTLPNPLPIFIYEEELNNNVVSLFRKNEKRLRYGEIIKQLLDSHKKDLYNYYLLFSQNTKDGLVFRDFDFVAKFEYELKSKITNRLYWEIKPLFTDKYTPKLNNIFEFQNQILPVIFNNGLIVRTKDEQIIVKYFDEIKQEYCKSAPNYLNILKYRKAFYDFVYKSQRKAITTKMFDDMMRVSILEDIRLDKIEGSKTKNPTNELTIQTFQGKASRHSENFNIRKKLNIWFSIREEFNHISNNKNNTMASKLKNYRQFMDELVSGTFALDDVNDKMFAYATGQLVAYVSASSKSENKTYRYLEPYLQSSSCERIKQLLSQDFKRYKHDIYKGVDKEILEDGSKKYFQTRFQRVAEFVMTYETETKLNDFLAEFLAGIFGENKIFKSKNEPQPETTN